MIQRNQFKRSALAFAIAIATSSAVMAQSSVGTINGHAESGSTVTIENLATGAKRSVSPNSEGRFSFTQLPTGRYKVTSGSQTREVSVNAGVGTQVEMGATELEGMVVTGESINPIDLSSVESATVFTAEQLQKIPVGRDVTNVALLAPGTVKGDTGFGNLASFGGSSVAENGYYINGFDVTNIRTFLSYATLPFEAIQEQGVKTGGYGAEYGRSLGGVISIVTKRGSNEWNFGASAYWSPSSLREDGKDVLSRDPDRAGSDDPLYVYRSSNESDDLKVNLYGGGPLIQDRLFFFGMLQAADDTIDNYGSQSSESTNYDQPNGMVKLDWNISDNHMVEFTGIYNRDDYTQRSYTSDSEFYTTFHDDLFTERKYQAGGEVYTGRYTGYLTDNFTLSVTGGYLINIDNYLTNPDQSIIDCATAYDSFDGGLEYVGCWDEPNFGAGGPRDPNFGPDEDTRKAFRVDGEWLLGDHQIRFGIDREKFTSGHGGNSSYSGGAYYRYFTAPGGNLNFNGTVVNLAEGTRYVRVRTRDTASASYDVINEALYLEDSWQATDSLLVYGGLRAETFENLNGIGETFVESDNLVAPRLGFSWDAAGDGSVKVFGNAGRYYIPVATNTNIRASGGEATGQSFFLVTGYDQFGAPVGLGAELGQTALDDTITNPVNSATVADKSLSPMYQDEYIIGTQFALADNWTLGVKGIRREVKDGMDDYCGHQAALSWAEDNGYGDTFDPGTQARCFLINPGSSADMALDLHGDGNLEVVTIDASYFGLPKYQRSYNALEFFFERAGGDNWQMQGSWTISHSYGNVEGYVNSSLEQGDPGLTQDFDHALFEDGAFGDLPNDRRHALKLFGSYRFTDEWSVGGNLLVQSGRPVNCQGYIPQDDPSIGIDDDYFPLYGASSFYCRDEAGNRVLTQRGSYGRTPWTRTLDATVAYSPNFADQKLTFRADVFNLFDADTVTEYNEVGDLTPNTTNLSPEFLNNVNFQTPRSVRFSVRYDF